MEPQPCYEKSILIEIYHVKYFPHELGSYQCNLNAYTVSTNYEHEGDEAL